MFVSYFYFFLALSVPQALRARPQDTVKIGCNASMVDTAIEERSGRPDYPDPQPKSGDKEPSSRVIFPGPMHNSLKNRTTYFSESGVIDRTPSFIPFVPSSERTPSCADGSTYCEEPDNYPKDYISQLLKSEKMIKGLFGQDDVSTISVSQRIDSSDETPICPSMEHVAYPKLAQNKEDKWLYIINQPENVQGIRVEKCIKEQPCTLSESLPIGYKTSCRQKYIYRKLVSISENGRPLTDSFRIPSCCSCHFRLTSVANRFGAENTSPAISLRNRMDMRETARQDALPSKRQPKSS
ncbi:protein spaetzle [Cloeon dipterum]|uniref:protein spaetzle n=1 Tax=Cloeon dipterum TaxID=197152 RepID=UPI0032203B82